jgi:methylmalonyl-CoA mutase cobalamin-binding subunit
VRELDDVRLYRVIEEATVVFGRLDIVDRFIFPLNKRVAGMVDVGELRSVHHGFLQAALRTVLSSLLLPSQADASRPVVLLTVPLAQRQEIGMIASAIHAYAAGWRPVLLGSGIPAEGVVEAAATTGAKAVILAVVSTRYDFGVWEELTRIRRSLDAEIPVYFGGRLPERLVDDLKEAGLQYLDDMEDLRSTLAARPA